MVYGCVRDTWRRTASGGRWRVGQASEQYDEIRQCRRVAVGRASPLIRKGNRRHWTKCASDAEPPPPPLYSIVYRRTSQVFKPDGHRPRGGRDHRGNNTSPAQRRLACSSMGPCLICTLSCMWRYSNSTWLLSPRWQTRETSLHQHHILSSFWNFEPHPRSNLIEICRSGIRHRWGQKRLLNSDDLAL